MKRFISENRKKIYMILGYALVCFGFMIFNHTISIDEDTWIMSDTFPTFWFTQGRFGIKFFNDIFTYNGQYAPFMWDVLSIMIWSCAGICLYYYLFGSQEDDSISLVIFATYFVSMPCVVGAILSFSMFNLQISLAMLLVVLGFGYIKEYVRCGVKHRLLVGIGMLIFSFSIYQAFITVFLTIVVAECLCAFLRGERKFVKAIVEYALCCVVAVLTYYSLNLLILKCNGINSSSYLSDTYVGWGNGRKFFDVLLGALRNIPKFLFNTQCEESSIYAGQVVLYVSAIFVVFLIYKVFFVKNIKEFVEYCFFSVALIIAPFLMYIMMGTENIQGRQLLGLPVLGAVELVLIVREFRGKIRKLVLIFASCILFFNARDMNLLYYYGYIVYQHDKNVANEIMYDVKRIGADYHNKPIVFIGSNSMDTIPIEKYETVTGSIFEWDGGNIYRLQNFFETEGYELLMPTSEEIEDALVNVTDMKPWPQSDSVREYDSYIVVYLSSPSSSWYAANGIEAK